MRTQTTTAPRMRAADRPAVPAPPRTAPERVTQERVPPPRAAARRRRVRYWAGSPVVRIGFPVFAGFYLALAVLFVGLGLAPASRGGIGTAGIVLGVSVALVGIALAVKVVVPAVVLTAHSLRRPRVLGRGHVTPFSEITGVGLVFQRKPGLPAPRGWFLYVWTAGNAPCALGIGYQRARWLRPPGQVRQNFLAAEPGPGEAGRPLDRREFGYRFNPVTQTDPAKIVATQAGRAAREIYERVLACQGPGGPLALRQDHKHVPVPASDQIAYWSPDGELGYGPAAPQLRAQRRAAIGAPRL